MKKVLSVVACFALCSALALPVHAASGINAEEQKILNVLKAGVQVNGKLVTLDASYMNAAENYLNSDGVNIAGDEATVVLQQMDAAIQVIVENNITDLKKIDKKFQDQIIAHAQIAAKTLGLTFVADYSSKTIIIKDTSGNVLFSVDKVNFVQKGDGTTITNGDIIKNTGDDFTQSLFMVGGIGFILLGAACIAAKKGLFVR